MPRGSWILYSRAEIDTDAQNARGNDAGSGVTACIAAALTIYAGKGITPAAGLL
jgi:hypothetical protein